MDEIEEWDYKELEEMGKIKLYPRSKYASERDQVDYKCLYPNLTRVLGTSIPQLFTKSRKGLIEELRMATLREKINACKKTGACDRLFSISSERELDRWRNSDSQTNASTFADVFSYIQTLLRKDRSKKPLTWDKRDNILPETYEVLEILHQANFIIDGARSLERYVEKLHAVLHPDKPNEVPDMRYFASVAADMNGRCKEILHHKMYSMYS
jgi:hypothetical protein